MSQDNEGAPFITDATREAVLHGMVGGYLLRRARAAPGRTAGVGDATRDDPAAGAVRELRQSRVPARGAEPYGIMVV